jgi:hypothetical protein
MYDIIEERFIACNAAIKTILEVLIGTGTVAPHAVGRLLRGRQSRECLDRGEAIAGALLLGFAEFAEDPTRIAGRRLLNEPPHGTA